MKKKSPPFTFRGLMIMLFGSIVMGFLYACLDWTWDYIHREILLMTWIQGRPFRTLFVLSSIVFFCVLLLTSFGPFKIETEIKKQKK